MTEPSRTMPDLSALLTHTSHVLSTRMSAAFAASGLGITPRGFCVLLHALEQERTQIQLAEIADLDKTTMVVTVDELERLGLAERRPSSTDRRARIISVTPAGAEAVTAGVQVADAVHREALEAVAEEDRAVLLRALTTLHDGHLATPVESERPVRRARRPRG
ncbi:MarR family winged helix-turn-helix transcriptional regulator [Kitasatospora sp. NPDC051853]|uniref:MarR family winged helix-turn-helix transcriptional regulator n=1 Tax=Kitasatospora sp. NPDC051853 TaxID=3364058 RepID=UPI0037B8C2E4